MYTMMWVIKILFTDAVPFADLRTRTRLGTPEFNTTGTLKTLFVIDRFHAITCPALIVHGTERERRISSLRCSLRKSQDEMG